MTNEAKSKSYVCVNKDQPGFRWPIHDCPNMKRMKDDTDMENEWYECEVCGKTGYLCYDEMR